MKTGTSMTRIIDTRKSKKNRIMIKCNCSICVNKERNGCRFGWEPINGKCNRFGTNHYKLSKEEKNKAREQTIINKQKSLKSKEIKTTNLKMLSKALGTVITREKIKDCTRRKYLGNGKYGIKCTDPEELLISVEFKDGRMERYKIID